MNYFVAFQITTLANGTTTDSTILEDREDHPWPKDEEDLEKIARYIRSWKCGMTIQASVVILNLVKL